jgi:hypothetical protein
MGLSKLKIVATVLGLGLAASALALGQDQSNSQPSSPSAETGRLREVERKLDRILDALDAGASRTKQDETTTVGRAANGLPSRFGEAFGRSKPRDTQSVRSEDIAYGIRRADTLTIETRVARVEQTLAELVERVSRLEGRGASSGQRPDGARFEAQRP